jgi:hypothetical protein
MSSLRKSFRIVGSGLEKRVSSRRILQFIGIHLLVKVFLSREEIGNSVWVTGNMGQLVVEVLEILNPAHLMTGDLLGLTEVLKVLMVGTNLNRMCGAKE